MTVKNAPVLDSVKMDDGRVVEFAGKRKLLKESMVAADGSVSVRLDWRNGETRLFVLPAALMGKFAAHGAEQKLGDEIAGLKDDKGNDADIEDCVLAVDELIERLNAGTWNEKRDSNGLAGTSILLKALIEHTGKTREAIAAFLKTKTHAQKLALRNSAKVKPIVERLEAEKAANATSKVDTVALLAELG